MLTSRLFDGPAPLLLGSQQKEKVRHDGGFSRSLCAIPPGAVSASRYEGIHDQPVTCFSKQRDVIIEQRRHFFLHVSGRSTAPMLDVRSLG